MKRLVAVGLTAILAVSMAGCGARTGDDAARDTLDLANELATALEKRESPNKIAAIVQRMRAGRDRDKDLKLSKEEREALKKKYEPELKAAQARINKAAHSIGETDKAYAEQIGEVMRELEGKQ
jgi:hypothetical protein